MPYSKNEFRVLKKKLKLTAEVIQAGEYYTEGAVNPDRILIEHQTKLLTKTIYETRDEFRDKNVKFPLAVDASLDEPMTVQEACQRLLKLFEAAEATVPKPLKKPSFFKRFFRQKEQESQPGNTPATRG